MKTIYIDVQNVHIATQRLGRVIDRKRFFVYLKDHYKVDKIYYAVGYLEKLQNFYDEIEGYGYTMLFKETGKFQGEVKGNVDIDIAIRSIFDLREQSLVSAYLISNDGDYNTLLKVWKEQGIFGGLIVPDVKTASHLTTRIAKDFLDLQRIKHLIMKKT